MNRKISEYIREKIRLIPTWLQQNLANSITLSRLVMAVWFLLTAINNPDRLWLIDILGGLATFTDCIDGPIARRYGKSVFGSILDILADHVFIYPALMVLIWHNRWKLTNLPFYTNGLTTALGILMLSIVGAIFIAGCIGAFYYYIKGIKIDLSPNKWGRRKTGCGFTVILVWLFSLSIEKYQGFPLINLSIFLIDLGLILMIYWGWKSLEDYYKRGIDEIKAQQ
ncbi:CDP-alcohol phosphatidyltransferase family protein [Patescibacteria group bacterium]|nr:CDP-alcohol phosphatidyltransferase family protein [Patescibacteria group bacterium]